MPLEELLLIGHDDAEVFFILEDLFDCISNVILAPFPFHAFRFSFLAFQISSLLHSSARMYRDLKLIAIKSSIEFAQIFTPPLYSMGRPEAASAREVALST